MSKAKYSKEFKLAVVQDYLSGKGSIASLAEKNGVGKKSLSDWVRQYSEHGAEAFTPQSGYRSYSQEFKLKCVKAVMSGEGSVDDIVVKYRISSRSVLNKWISKYNAHKELKDYDPKKLSFELDFTANKSIYTSDLIITDWSGIGPEFCFATKRPAIFINTKLKCCNPNYEKIALIPTEISLRSELGVALNKEECNNIKDVCEDLFNRSDEYNEKITKIFDSFIFNHNKAAQAGANYILKSIASKKKQD